MANRPALTTDSLLAAFLRPKTAPIPVGLRKQSVKATRGRKVARVRAFNKMNPVSQHALERTGNREAYLKGYTSLADVKREVRPQAVSRGIIADTVWRGDAVHTIIRLAAQRSEIDRQGKLKSQIRESTIRKNVARMTQAQRRKAASFQTYDELRADMDDDYWENDDDGGSLLFYK